MDFITQYEERTFLELKAKYGDAVVSQSYLRIENKILNNKSDYDFPILATGSEVTTEKKLDKNDMFVCTRLFMGIYQRDTSLANEGVQPLQTYPNQTYFVTGTSWVKTDLEALYNGFIQFKKGTTVIGENIPTSDFRWIGQTLQSGSNANSEYYGGRSGFKPLTPAVSMPGREQFAIRASFVTYTGILWANDAANKENRIVMMPFGFLVKGANV